MRLLRFNSECWSEQVLVLLLVAWASSMPFATFAQGQFPALRLTDLNGKPIEVQQVIRQHRYTLIVWWATWCVPCRKELHVLKKVYDRWKKQYNVEVIAISVDDARSMSRAKAYARAQGWQWLALFDPQQQSMRAVGFRTVPFAVLVDQNGNIVKRKQGYMEGDEKTWENAMKQ